MRLILGKRLPRQDDRRVVPRLGVGRRGCVCLARLGVFYRHRLCRTRLALMRRFCFTLVAVAEAILILPAVAKAFLKTSAPAATASSPLARSAVTLCIFIVVAFAGSFCGREFF